MRLRILFLFLLNTLTLSAQQKVENVSGLNTVEVAEIIRPQSTEEIIKAVKNAKIVSVGGSRHSMGGQIATEGSVHLDMRSFNKILQFSKDRKEITVQTGITWREIQQYIDSYDLAISIMQSYSNFTVGGSLSVNVHGRYIGMGPIILSVKSIKIIQANGEVISASQTENPEIFYGVIGGYGGLGIITECTLKLADNCKVQRISKLMPVSKYKRFFMEKIRNDSSIIFHNGNIYPYAYKKVRAVSYIKTNKNVTVNPRIKAHSENYMFSRLAFKIVSEWPGGKWFRQHIADPVSYIKKPVEWRNYEASLHTDELEPRSRKKSTYLLQEYFVPIDSFDAFYPLMADVFRRHKVNVINVSIRHARQDPGSTLAWAKTEVFAFVIYFKQGTKPQDIEEVKSWTHELINLALECNGSYYLPYQIFATQEQFIKAYPNAGDFFILKKKIDPTNKFRNKLWDTYYK